MKLVRVEDLSKENDEIPPEKRVKLNGGDFYCPYRAWLFSRKWIVDPSEHIYCGKPACWSKFDAEEEFKNKELKVEIINQLIRWIAKSY